MSLERGFVVFQPSLKQNSHGLLHIRGFKPLFEAFSKYLWSIYVVGVEVWCDNREIFTNGVNFTYQVRFFNLLATHLKDNGTKDRPNEYTWVGKVYTKDVL